MSVMSIRIDDAKREALKTIASVEGKSIDDIVSELIEEKLQMLQKPSESEGLRKVMQMSEQCFAEWDNEEDEIYNTL